MSKKKKIRKIYIEKRDGRSFTVIFDDEDTELLSKYSWNISFMRNGNPRAEARINYKITRMHRYILGIKDSAIKVDHINGNTLDNRRENLRASTNAQNLRNRGKTRANTSGYKGVTKTRSGKWRAQIKKNYKGYLLGTFLTKEEAYEAYCEASKRLHKEFANNGKN